MATGWNDYNRIWYIFIRLTFMRYVWSKRFSFRIQQNDGNRNFFYIFFFLYFFLTFSNSSARYTLRFNVKQKDFLKGKHTVGKWNTRMPNCLNQKNNLLL